MKRINYKIAFTYQFLLLAMLTAALSSCEKDRNEELNLSRMFAPGTVAIEARETEVELKWNPSLYTNNKEVSYQVELSKTQDFAAVDYSVTTDTNTVVITENEIKIKQPYYARLRANASPGNEESKWIVSAATFLLTGEQYFLSVKDNDIRSSHAMLRFRDKGATKIILTTASGQSKEFAVSAADNTRGSLDLAGLAGNTAYTATIYQNDKEKGTAAFKTKESIVYTSTISPGADLAAIITAAPANSVIGHQPGEYAVPSAVNISINQKSITLASVSENPLDTKISSKEILLRGTGAGLKFLGIEFNGNTSAGAGNYNAAYFIDLRGVVSDTETASFAPVIVENSVIHGTSSCLIRGNRSGNNAFKIPLIRFVNNVVYDNGAGGFDYILLDKMEFAKVEILQSTFYNSGRRLVSWATNITVPGSAPVVLIDKVTINNIGYGGRDYVIFDGNGNTVDFTLTNSILANAPRPGSPAAANGLAVRTSASSKVVISNNNTFKFTNGTAALTFPGTPANMKTADLGWTAATTDFTVPSGSELLKASTSAGPIGDPRWVN